MEDPAHPTEVELWKKVRDILFTALETAPENRKSYLDKSCSGDAQLRSEVESLIAVSEHTTLIDEPALPSGREMLTLLQGSEAPSNELELSVVGHYQVLEKIGEGGMGTVYKALDKNLDRIVALKVLPQGHERWEEKQRFAREAKAASALNHPNIVTIYEFGNADGLDFIAMEFVEGSTLSKLLHERHVPLPKLLGYARQTAGAIAKAHAAGIVHRDLKPANIMITGDGVVKVLDFGLATLVQSGRAAADPDATVRQELTRMGAIMGTPPYMSPEQALGERTDARTDIFSFGTILYEIASGRRPFDGSTSHLTLHQVATVKQPDLAELNPNAPPALVVLVDKCLIKNREDRPRSMAEVAHALEDLIAGMNVTPPTAALKSVGRRNLIAAGLVSAAALAGVLLVGLWPASKPPEGKPVQGGEFTYSIETQRVEKGKLVGEPYAASPKDTFQGGWKFRIAAQSPEPGSLYLINQGPGQSGNRRYYLLYPAGGQEAHAELPANQTVRTGWYEFDGNPGTEQLWIVWSAKQVAEIEAQLRESKDGSVGSPAAARAIETLLAGLKQGQRSAAAMGKIRVATESRAEAFTEMLELAHR